ncbi:hypothetical protein C3747_122g251c [Trypanosoma cruzi]|uniref:COPI associated protein n=2 Tax=Trypanosoma cruzi TaxID=5693 RepID=Q4CU07_TRYCC|nr:hypothetical protein, conserved [Trypanosoma cruzi]EAN83760.1 hypothetical protein, conserved [Trypanosoma cruzi]PWV05957.1 hypothetical protein C3747_122g251c [Trypanosoma cruzi]RNC43077.1 putative golgi apparatus membrane protein [Trypanosoma cruzi]|eukprot:XP_805611.1 hypothetical protein [Trypanosoma cruzi strain CL Brener]
MPTFREIVTAKNFVFLLKFLGVAGAFGSGSLALFLLMWFRPHELNEVRMFIAYVYIIFFSVISPAAEVGMMQHRHLMRFTRFLLSNIGRAFLYVFIGGLLLGTHIAGWIVGVYMISLGVLNIFAYCVTGEDSTV